MTYMMSNIENMKQNNASVPAAYEIAAVVEAAMEGWDYGAVSATAENGVNPEDRQNIAGIITEHELECSVEECAKALYAYCCRVYTNAETDLIR